MALRTVAVEIDSNRVTCGDCQFLVNYVNTYGPKGEWHCNLYNVGRGLRGAQKTPNRAEKCLKAERSTEC